MSTLNFNIGILGHVDSGKTSLAKALSTVESTACFDKNPQSKERGITLDLGFSSFKIESSSNLKEKGYNFVQYTLVDCPGHASLIKTIIGGAQIIDMMILVIDIKKGIQTQTSECLIIGEICCDKMLIVLNKLDLIEENMKDFTINRFKRRILKTLENTKFADTAIIAVSAIGGLNQCTNIDEKKSNNLLNIDLLLDTIRNMTYLPERKNKNGPFFYSVDHCFNIKGQGTVLTGTVLGGTVKINDTIEIPILNIQKKVKSIQVYKIPVEKAEQGDRCGICISGLDSKIFERGVVCSPNFLKYSYGLIISINKIKYYKGLVESGSKFHVSIGHETLIGKIELFGELENSNQDISQTSFDFSKEYIYVRDLNYIETIEEKANFKKINHIYALLDFNNENNKSSDHVGGGVLCSLNSLLIGSKLDTDINLNQCRIAFSGHVLHQFTNKDYRETNANKVKKDLSKNLEKYLYELKVFKEKSKEGIVERKHDEMTVIGKSLFKKETNMDLFIGLKVHLSTGEEGIIEGSFGQSGKFRIRILNGLFPSTKDIFEVQNGKIKNRKQDLIQGTIVNQIKVNLNYKYFIYDDRKRLTQ